MIGLPKIGQVVKRDTGAMARMKKTIESKRNGALAIAGGKPRNAVKFQQEETKKQEEALERVFNKPTLVDDLTDSVETNSMRGRDSQTRISTKRETNENEDTMAAKKKTAKTAAKAPTQGREHKMLLRLSASEMKKLEQLKKETGKPKAQLLRDGCKLSS